MKKRVSVIIAVLLCVLMMSESALCFASEIITSASGAGNSLNRIKESDYAKGEAIAILKNSADSNYMLKSKASQLYGKDIKIKDTCKITGKKNKNVFKAVCVKSASKSTEELIAELEKNPAVDHAYPNYSGKADALTDDTYSGYQWALDNTGQDGGTVGKDINADALWRQAASSSKESVVAVMDSGINPSHEDLKDVLWQNPYSDNPELPGVYGYDFGADDDTPEDTTGHGTHVAGIIAASADNSKGISGVNTSKTRIMALKVSNPDDGRYYVSNAFAAFEYVSKAVDLGVNVVAVNCSFVHQTATEKTKIDYENLINTLGEKGVITCISAGNESENLNNYYEDKGVYKLPAMCESDYKLTVAACNEKDKLASFSNYGDKYVDIAAPGVKILSTYCKNIFEPSIYTESERREVCTCYQGYSDFSNNTDFGLNYSAEAYNGHSLKISDGNSVSFGKDKGSLKIESTDGQY